MRFHASFYLYALLSFTSCQSEGNKPSQSTNRGRSDCQNSYDTILKGFYEYHSNNDTLKLKSILSAAEQCLLCSDTKLFGINSKYKVLTVLEEYELGIAFIDSLKQEDVSPPPYRKRLMINYLKSKQAAKAGNISLKDSLLSNTASMIEAYLASKNWVFDIVVFEDLLFLKSEYYKSEDFDKEMDSLISKYPTQEFYFNARKTNANEASVDMK